jgi:hypothetical protein
MREVPKMELDRFGSNVVHSQPVKAGDFFQAAVKAGVEANDERTSGNPLPRAEACTGSIWRDSGIASRRAIRPAIILRIRH